MQISIWNLPLISGTILTTIIAISVSLPIGLTIAIYLSEYAPKLKKFIKPLLEILAAVPTVVYGFFALMVVTPLQKLIPEMAGFKCSISWNCDGNNDYTVHKFFKRRCS